MPGGRPKIQTSQFEEGWQDRIIELMTEGASKVEVYSMLDIDKETFSRLAVEDQEFSDTVKRGLVLSEAWWEKQGRTELKGKDFNATLWYMNMKNRFDWADKKEIKQQVSGQLDTGATNPELAAKFAEFLKGQ